MGSHRTSLARAFLKFKLAVQESITFTWCDCVRVSTVLGWYVLPLSASQQQLGEVRNVLCSHQAASKNASCWGSGRHASGPATTHAGLAFLASLPAFCLAREYRPVPAIASIDPIQFRAVCGGCEGAA